MRLDSSDHIKKDGHFWGNLIGFATVGILTVILGIWIVSFDPFPIRLLMGPMVYLNKPFDPHAGTILPKKRVVAFYGIPRSRVPGPAYKLDNEMLQALKDQGAAYARLDPDHPVVLGIDLVVSVPDRHPGPKGYYSHHVSDEVINEYVDFCRRNGLILFLDLNFGRAPVMEEVEWAMPWLEENSFVHLAIDPEWAFPRKLGIPGYNIGQLDASDINPIIDRLAKVPYSYEVPRKMFLIHQYRKDVLENKDKIKVNPLVDTVVHIDSVGGFRGDIETKQIQYKWWVTDEMKANKNFKYGGFKIFYWLEARNRLMTPEEVLALDPAPMVITYGH